MDDAQTLRSMVRDDAYRVIKVLADGPSGKTELVTLDGEGPLVRKHIPASLANASAWAAAMELDEPLLPRIESLYRMPDELVVVYEYVLGTSLEELVHQKGRLDAKMAADAICDVCRAVSALHERGVVHRDITPGNVIVADDGAHLVDLGIARQKAQGRRHDTTTLGTWGFAAPEQFGFAQTDARSDVYSIGCLLGYLLTGEQPSTDAYEEALDRSSLVAPPLAKVVRRASSFEPSARYQSARDLSDALRKALVSVQPGAGHASANVQAPYERRAPRADEAAKEGWQGVDATASNVVSSVEPRKLEDVPVPLLVLTLLGWGCLALLAIVMVWTSVDSVVRHDPPWGTAERVMSAVCVVAIGALAREIYQAVTWSGAYARKTGKVRLLINRSCKIVAIVFGSVFIVALMFPQK